MNNSQASSVNVPSESKAESKYKYGLHQESFSLVLFALLELTEDLIKQILKE